MPAIVSIPPALGGDSLAGNSAAGAALGLFSMLVGYLLLAGLWYFVFRRRPDERARDARTEAARQEAVRDWRPASGVSVTPNDAERSEPGVVHGRPLRIDRSAGATWRRR